MMNFFPLPACLIQDNTQSQNLITDIFQEGITEKYLRSGFFWIQTTVIPLDVLYHVTL